MAGLLVFLVRPGSGWLFLAGAMVCVCAFVGVVDLLNIKNASPTILGREATLVSPGWGIWLTVIASIVAASAVVGIWVTGKEEEEDAVEAVETGNPPN